MVVVARPLRRCGGSGSGSGGGSGGGGGGGTVVVLPRRCERNAEKESNLTLWCFVTGLHRCDEQRTRDLGDSLNTLVG